MYESDKVINLFVEGISPEIRTLLQAYRDEKRWVLYLELIQQEKYEGDEDRVRNATDETARTTLKIVHPAGA